MKIFVRKNNSTIGPLTEGEFLADWKKGKFVSSDLICTDGQNWISIKDSKIIPSGSRRKNIFRLGLVAFCFSVLLALIFFFADVAGVSNWLSGGETRDLDYFDWSVEESEKFKKGATVLISLLGDVRVSGPEEKVFDEARKGQVLLPGSKLETGKDGEAVILFSNGSSTAVGKNTKFRIHSFVQEDFNSSTVEIEEIRKETSPSRIKLELDLGELVVVVKKLERDSSITLSSKLGFAGVRGTSFSMNAQADSTSVNVLSGQVDFLNLNEMSKLVNAGKSARSTGMDLKLVNEIPQADRVRIEAMEEKAKAAIREIPISELKKAFDQVNPTLAWCDPVRQQRSFLAAGGTKEVSDAIEKGMEWLVSMQQEDGSWGGNDRDEQGNPKKTDASAMTGMAVICLLQNCDNDSFIRNNSALKKGIEYLKAVPVSEVKSQPDSYSHPIYTRALIKAFAKLKIPELEELATKLVSTIVRGQNKNGGWAYSFGKGPLAHVDLSVTGWNVMALAEAQSVGLKVNGLDVAIVQSMGYVKKCQDNTGRFAYQIGKGGKPSLTGMGVHCLHLGNHGDSNEANKGLDWLFENLPSESDKINFYGLRHSSKACFSSTYLGKRKYWMAFNQKVIKLLLELQRVDGSWKPANHFHGDTEIFRTTLALDTLLTFYGTRY